MKKPGRLLQRVTWGSWVSLVVVLGAFWFSGCQKTSQPRIHIYDVHSPQFQSLSFSRECGESADSVCFVALGDAGKANEGQYKIADAIEKKCERDGCQFSVYLGDNFYPNGVKNVDDPQWLEKFEKPYARVELPFYAILGNHDYGTLGNNFAKGDYEIQYGRKNPKWIMPSQYYDFVKSRTHFIALDTAMAMWDFEHSVDKQLKFVSQAISRVSADWRIFLGHHPYYSNGTHGNAGSYEDKSWLPIANGKFVKRLLKRTICKNADLYLSGHDHSLQLLPTSDDCATLFAVSGAGASTTKLKARNPTLFESSQIGFAYIVVAGKTLHFQFVDENAHVIFAMDVQK